MVDQVLLSAGRKNIQECIALADEYGLGIEVMNFAYPDVLDGDWQSELTSYQAMLEPVRARRSLITLHGPFMDMAPGSPDKQIEGLVTRRYQHAIRIASALGAKIVVLHANFIAAIQEETYRIGWQQRNIEFWRGIGAFAAGYRITVAVENMWEFDPYIIADVLHAVDHPNVRACIDVGHAHLFSRMPFDEWLRTISPFLIHVHMNNNDGKYDIHRALTDGVLEYTAILEQLRDLSASLPQPLSMTLEMDSVDDMRRSLRFFQLANNPGADDSGHADAHNGLNAAPVSKSDTAELPPVLVDAE